MDTIARFNGFAASGTDLDFGRGGTDYQRITAGDMFASAKPMPWPHCAGPVLCHSTPSRRYRRRDSSGDRRGCARASVGWQRYRPPVTPVATTEFGDGWQLSGTGDHNRSGAGVSYVAVRHIGQPTSGSRWRPFIGMPRVGRSAFSPSAYFRGNLLVLPAQSRAANVSNCHRRAGVIDHGWPEDCFEFSTSC